MNIKPIVMRCNSQQWEEIKPILEKHKIKIFDISYRFDSCPYLVNNLDGILGEISNSPHKNIYNRTVFEEWNQDVFLEYCGIKEKKQLFTIKDLSEGRCAVINDGTLEELHQILKLAFDNSFSVCGVSKYWFKEIRNNYPIFKFNNFY